MHAKLRVNRGKATLNELCEASQLLREGSPFLKKLNLIAFIRAGADNGWRRKEFASLHGISSRTLNRWINQFNTWGLAGILAAPSRPGRKRKVDRKVFREQILPEVERAVQADGMQVTVMALFRSARAVGVFPASYATFRRCLGVLRHNYRRPRIEPNIDEWLFHTQTVRVGDDGKVPVGSQRQPIDAPPRTTVIRCLRPDGDIYYLRHAPNKKTKPIVLLHCPVF